MKQQPTSLEQYQQTFRQAVETEVQRQLTQNRRSELSADDKTANQKLVDSAVQWFNKGLAELSAYGRMGLDEISHALKAFPDSVPMTPEPGALGEPTPQQVFAEQQGKSPMELYQRDLYTPSRETQKQQEMER